MLKYIIECDVRGNDAPGMEDWVRIDCFTLLTESAQEKVVILSGLFEPDMATLDLICDTPQRGLYCTVITSKFYLQASWGSIQKMDADGVNIRIYPCDYITFTHQ